MVHTTRGSPRFVDEHRVQVRFEQREELEQLWTEDISKGGMFLKTDQPPPLGTKLEIELSTPEGQIELNAEVVHVADGKEEGSQGIGVQLLGLSSDVHATLNRYMDGLATRFSFEELSQDLLPDAEELVEEAQIIMEKLLRSDLYDALGVDASASTEEIIERIDFLRARFSLLPPELSPNQLTRFEHLVRQILRVAKMFSDPIRRLHFDFRHGHIRYQERLSRGEDIELLHEVWGRCRPQEVRRAKQKVREALRAQRSGDEKYAKRQLLEAVELDPFSATLREVLQRLSRSAAEALDESDDELHVVEMMDELSERLVELNHFEVLGVTTGSSKSDIEAAYSVRHHRFRERETWSVSQKEQSRAILARLHDAYEILSDEEQRKQYECALAEVEARAKEAAQAASRKMNEMAKECLQDRRYEEARALLTEAVTLDPDCADCKAHLAWAMVSDTAFPRMEAHQRGRILLEEALRQVRSQSPTPRAQVARYHHFLGRIFKERGDVKAALKHFDNATMFDSQLTEAKEEASYLRAQFDASVKLLARQV